jgi:alkylation response protein AidB-like acyl-CoA dehydrogenase
VEFKLSKEEQLIHAIAREFAEKSIEPFMDRIIARNRVPDEIIAGLKELDLFALPISDEYGGIWRCRLSHWAYTGSISSPSEA